MIKLAIVSPCYNEEEVLEESTTRLTNNCTGRIHI